MTVRDMSINGLVSIVQTATRQPVHFLECISPPIEVGACRRIVFEIGLFRWIGYCGLIDLIEFQDSYSPSMASSMCRDWLCGNLTA